MSASSKNRQNKQDLHADYIREPIAAYDTASMELLVDNFLARRQIHSTAQRGAQRELVCFICPFHREYDSQMVPDHDEIDRHDLTLAQTGMMRSLAQPCGYCPLAGKQLVLALRLTSIFAYVE
jgi:hypothetical protein